MPIVVVSILATLAACTSTRHTIAAAPMILLDSMEVTAPRSNPYRATETKLFDLIHTKLAVSFDIPHQWLWGRETVTLTPHCYPQHKLVLDAKYMRVFEVSVLYADGRQTPLTFAQDSFTLTIHLDREYAVAEKITLYMEYQAKPTEHKSGGSAAIIEDKGIYFINPLGKDTSEPTEIWTQGETESSSCWFPTLDKPNQKTTQELSITIDPKYTTLSNGLLISQTINPNGLRTDYWRMDQPHAPYLFMMAIGKFNIVKDRWRDKEVSYYMEPAFSRYARQIFGQTTSMMDYYSTLFGVDYPWAKYAQVVVRDYVSGAMENTSATLHGEFLNRTPRQLIDEDYHDVISHELVHQWFGDLVTAESWSNITVNESFADYGEYLWNEHHYSRAYADWRFHQSLMKYMNESQRGKNVNLVRFYYDNREDVFDAHSYEKGGHILHMLRNEIGDTAFFKSLKLYLNTYRYKSTEAHQLRLAFEEVTGRDLTTFFNQWYYQPGHPRIRYQYRYTSDSIYITATQQHNVDDGFLYELPLRIDIHYGAVIDSRRVILHKKSQTWAYPALSIPDLIDADPERSLLCERNENKTTTQYAYQYRYGSNVMQQLEALDTLRRIQRIDSIAGQVCMQALRDPLPQLRAYAVQSAQFTDKRRDSLLHHIRIMAVRDSAAIVRAAAIAALGRARDTTSIPILLHALSDTSYAVEAQALRALHEMDSMRALRETNRYATETSYELRTAVYSIIATTGDSTYFPYLLDRLDKETSIAQYALVSRLADYVGRMTPSMADTAISRIKALIDEDDDRWLRRAAVSAVTQIKGDYELKKALLPTKPTTALILEGEIYHRIATHAREVLKAWKDEE